MSSMNLSMKCLSNVRLLAASNTKINYLKFGFFMKKGQIKRKTRMATKTKQRKSKSLKLIVIKKTSILWHFFTELTSSDQENDRKDQLKMDKRVIIAVVISLAVVLILGLGIGLGVNWSKNNEDNGRNCKYF